MLRSGWCDEKSPFMRAFTTFFLPNSSFEELKWFLEFERVAASAESAVRVRKAIDDINVVHLLPQVSVPTLVFHCAQDNIAPFEPGRLIAASIPNAKFVSLESEN